MRILLIGDIVGKPGMQVVRRRLQKFRDEEGVDFVVANAENAYEGSGLTPELYEQLIAAGVDCVTLGDHAFRRKKIFEPLRARPNVLRPGNYPREAPGREFTVLTARNGVAVGVFVLLGRVFMQPVDCPLHAADRILAAMPPEVKVILLDMHAEATSDKQLMGRHLDGRVSAVLGTHTHVATADERILPGGTAFQCDVGMTGPHDSILGRRADRVLETVYTFRPTQFEVASDDVRMHGTLVEVDPESGRAASIRRVVVSLDEQPRPDSGVAASEPSAQAE